MTNNLYTSAIFETFENFIFLLLKSVKLQNPLSSLGFRILTDLDILVFLLYNLSNTFNQDFRIKKQTEVDKVYRLNLHVNVKVEIIYLGIVLLLSTIYNLI